MKQIPIPRMPLHLYGTYVVCGAGLILAIVSFVQSCRRPVTALTDIPMRSQTFIRETGRIIRSPAVPKYAATDIRPGDTIVSYDGLSWEHAQRLNLHEITNRAIGETLDLVVKRGEHTITTSLDVKRSDPWEKLVLSRFAIAAMLCWIPSTYVLVSFTRNVLRQTHHQHIADPIVQRGNSGVPLWVLSWQGTGIALSMSGLKYPVAFLLASILGQVMPMFIAIASLPYPLAPRTRLLKVAEYALVILSVPITTTLIKAGIDISFPSPDGDWRRSVIVVNTIHDSAVQWVNSTVILSIALASVGIFTLAFSRQYITLLHRMRFVRAATWLAQIYRDCPPALREIAQFQFMIVVVYLILDILPRSILGTGSGYSVLFSLIPLSYLLLHSDIRARKYGHRLILALTGTVMLLQLPHAIYRVATHTFDLGGSWNDVATILVLSFGSIFSGGWIAWNQRNRRKNPPDILQSSIDRLFAIQQREPFWNHLTKNVGKHLGVQTWLWLSKTNEQEWQVTMQTDYVRIAWLEHPEVQAYLTSPDLSKPIDVLVDTSEMPTTLIILPVYRDDVVRDVWLVANPRAVIEGVDLLENPLIHGRLRDALHALRGHERKQQYAEQEHLLAVQRQEIAQAYQKLFRQQRNKAQTSQTQISALLHDKSLQWLVELKRNLSMLTHEQHLSSEHQHRIGETVAQCDAINDEIRRIISDLRPAGFGQNVPALLEDVVDNWQQHHRTVAFKLRQTEHIPDFTEHQHNAIFLVVNQAVENAIKHGMATTITIRTRQDTYHFVLEIQDNGRGFDQKQEKGTSLGLLLMHDLADEMGGTLDVESHPGRGCQVTLAIPYEDIASQAHL